jgi:putative phosphoesterase
MRIAVFGDIHGNIHALEPVLAAIERGTYEAVYCLGDLVGYGAFPDRVTERIQSDGYPTIMGNYDDGVGFDRAECGCAYRDPDEEARGQRSLAWTKAHTNDRSKSFLRSLHKEIRFTHESTRVLLVHGSPRRMNEYLFEDRPIASFQRLAATSDADVIVFGHTHKPYVKLVDGVLFVNAGSVGKPKDGDWRACYAVLDLDGTPSAAFERVEYDVGSAAAAIRETDLPHEFATDIETGGRAYSAKR